MSILNVPVPFPVRHEYAVPSFEVSSSLQLLQSLRAMQPGRGGCNHATTSTIDIDRVVKGHSQLGRSPHLSLVRRCRR
jgi:hypothetical protein